MKTKSRAAKTKKSKKLTLKDRLSHLTHYRACQLLGPEGRQLIQQGAAYEIDLDRDVYFRGDLFRLKLRGAGGRGKDAVATITAMTEAKNRLRFNCTACRDDVRAHRRGRFAGAGGEDGAGIGRRTRRATAPGNARASRSCSNRPFSIAWSGREPKSSKSARPTLEKPWADYTVTSALSGKTYRVALRGEERGDSFCSCPDFRTNTLGTCKHILHVLHRVKRRFPAEARQKALSQPRGLRPRALRRGTDAPPAIARSARSGVAQSGRFSGRRADRRRAAIGRLRGEVGSAGPQRYGLPRRRGVDPTAAVRAAHEGPDGRDPKGSGCGIRFASNS